MRVVILCGLPGVGKLTVAKGLARLGDYRVFHNHLVFDAVEALFSFDSAAFVEMRERLWIELLSRAASERIGNVIFTIAGDRALRSNFPKRLASMLSRLGVGVCWIELVCNIEDLEERITSTDRSRFGKVTSVESFRQLNAAGAFPRLILPPGASTVDTSGLSSEESVAAVNAQVNRANHAT